MSAAPDAPAAPVGPDALPPGPGASAVVQTLAFHRDPVGVLKRAQTRFGPIFTLRLAIAGPVVAVCDPAAVEPLLEADPSVAHAGEARRRMLPMASPRSVFAGDGETYHAAHRRIAPAFAPSAVDQRRDEMSALAREHADRWPRARPFRLLPKVRTMVDEIFVRTVLGVREPERATKLVTAIRRMLRSPGNPPLPLPGEGNDTLPAVAGTLFAWRRAPVTRLLGDAIEARRRQGCEGEDVIGVLTRAAPDLETCDLVDELLPVIMAAQEPPSVALTWVLDRLGRDGLHDRYADADDPAFRDAVTRETLRLQPPALAVLRRLTAPLEIAGARLPGGTVTILPIPLLHRAPDRFPEPDAFRPDRWLSGTVREDTYLPFGGGARRCLGEHLAQAYFETVVPAVARHVRLRPLSQRPERMVVRATTLVPQRGVLVRHRNATRERS